MPKFDAWAQFARCMATLGFWLTTFSSSLFLILTIFYVKEKVGSYKNHLLVLPVTGFLFALCEFVMDPFFYSYNKAFAFFRLSSFETFSLTFNTCVLGSYVAFYGTTISVLALQFVYRYWAVFSPTNIQRFFDGPRFVFPLLFVTLSFVAWFTNAFVFNSQDDYSSAYLEKDVFESYGVIISQQPAFILVAYNKEGNIRLRNSLRLLVVTLLLVGLSIASYATYGDSRRFSMPSLSIAQW